MSYECNGNGTHIAIAYGSEPCPLCSCYKEIDRILDAYDNLSEDLKGELEDEPLGKIIEAKLQKTDLLFE